MTPRSDEPDLPFTVARHVGAARPSIEALELLATAEGHAFVARTIADWDDGSNRFDAEGECFHLAVMTTTTTTTTGDGRPIGMCGLNIDPYDDLPVDPDDSLDDTGGPTPSTVERVGRLRHLYVAPSQRRSGAGRLLVIACLATAAEHFDQVRLRTTNPAAAEFYRSLGFVEVDDAHATHRWRP